MLGSSRRPGWTLGAVGPKIWCVELVRIYETLDPVRGLLVRGLLESEGIRVLAKGEGTGPYRTGPVILLVDLDDVPRATELVSASEAGSLALGNGEGSALD
jgi:Putative prokaryotic signal transducing protein